MFEGQISSLMMDWIKWIYNNLFIVVYVSIVQAYVQNKDLPIKKWLCGSISGKNFHPMLNNHQQPLQWGKNSICSMHLCNKLLVSGEELNISLYAKIMWSYEFRIFFKKVIFFPSTFVVSRIYLSLLFAISSIAFVTLYKLNFV